MLRTSKRCTFISTWKRRNNTTGIPSAASLPQRNERKRAERFTFNAVSRLHGDRHILNDFSCLLLNYVCDSRITKIKILKIRRTCTLEWDKINHLKMFVRMWVMSLIQFSCLVDIGRRERYISWFHALAVFIIDRKRRVDNQLIICCNWKKKVSLKKSLLGCEHSGKNGKLTMSLFIGLDSFFCWNIKKAYMLTLLNLKRSL